MSSGYELEVTLVSAKDVKNVNWRHGATRPYAVVWVDSDRKVTTRVDEEDGEDPNWNEKFVLPLSRPIDDDITLYIDIVHAKNADEVTKPLIGSSKLKLHEILDQAGGYGAVFTKKLKVKRPSGRPHGKVSIEAVVHDRRYGYGAPPPGQYSGVRGFNDAPPPVSGHYGYSAPPPVQYGGVRGYNEAPPPVSGHYGYSAPPPDQYGSASAPPQHYGHNVENQEKKSSFGGMGTGLAIGAAAGLAGGVALAVGYDALTDSIAEDAAEKVEAKEESDSSDSASDDE